MSEVRVFPAQQGENSIMKKENLNNKDFILKLSHVNNGQHYEYLSMYSPMPVPKNIHKDDAELNFLSYRCDNFTNSHDGMHLLFTGCSVTWGNGLNVNEVWSKKVYDKINSITKCSGYFNLSNPGTGLYTQIVNLFKYFKTYGNPQAIFFNIPDINRFYFYDKTSTKIYDAFYSSQESPFLKFLSYQYYLMLEQYCHSHQIKLFSFTWSEIGKKDFTPLENFSSFYKIDSDTLLDFVYEYKNNFPNDVYSVVARDGDHFGTAFHEYWYNFIYSKYEESL